jgi:hypothetical protein
MNSRRRNPQKGGSVEWTIIVVAFVLVLAAVRNASSGGYALGQVLVSACIALLVSLPFLMVFWFLRSRSLTK